MHSFFMSEGCLRYVFFMQKTEGEQLKAVLVIGLLLGPKSS